MLRGVVNLKMTYEEYIRNINRENLNFKINFPFNCTITFYLIFAKNSPKIVQKSS